MAARRRIALMLTAGALVVGTLAAPAHAKPSGGLSPGELVTYSQVVPVNVVLIGYSQQEVEAGLLAELSTSSTPLVRVPQFYGVTGRDLGLEFVYDYRLVDAPRRFEDRFFQHLADIGSPRQPTEFQSLYNEQESNVLDVIGPVLAIDGPATERYLERSARQLGLDARRGYTVFLVNWFGRDDFQFHVYTKTDSPDPDTGFNFGAEYDSRSTIAWGGTSGRTWFYDLSAGPEAWTANFIVDERDLDGNAVEDYRMPPIWEYSEAGYRSRAALPSDLGKVVRYVAVNLLFTPSPLYDPLVTAPQPGGAKRPEVVMFEDEANSTGTDWFNPNVTRRQLQRLEPYHRWSIGVSDIDPIDPAAKRSLDIWAELDPSEDCWTTFGTPFAQLFCYADANRSAYLPASDTDYIIGNFAFNTTDAAMGSWVGLLGYADDNWVDGTQSYIFAFGTPEARELGYGFTTLMTHEVGHHLGLSHVHDGYDPELGLDYGAVDAFYYAWVGDESDTVMSYLWTSPGFSTFDQDNMARYQFAAYLNQSNILLGAIEETGAADTVRGLLQRADARARRAQERFQRWNFIGSADDARHAYELVRSAADRVGVDIEPTTERRSAATSALVPHEGDPIRVPDS